MLVIFGILLILFFGVLLSLFIAPEMKILERLGLSYVLGLGILTLFMFYLTLLGQKFSFQNTLIILLALIFVFSLLTRKRLSQFVGRLKKATVLPKLSLVEKGIIVLIILIFGYSLFFTFYWPVHTWDSLVLYDFRGKLFAESGTLPTQIKESYFWGYPLLTSLAHTVVYLFGGENPLFLYSLFFIGFGLMFYGALREFASRLVGLLGLFLLVITPPLLAHSTISYTNMPYTVYFVMGVIYAYIAMRKEKKGYFILSALLVGLSLWTRKATPFWLVILGVFIIVSLVKRKIKEPAVYGLIVLAIRQPWEIFVSRLLSSQSLVQQAISSVKIDIFRFFEVLAFLNKYVISSWGPLIWLFLAIFILDVLKFGRRKSLILFSIIAFCLFTLVGGTYVFSYHSEQWKEIPGSAIRLSIFFPPLFIYYIGTSETIKWLFKQTRWKIGKNLLKR